MPILPYLGGRIRPHPQAPREQSRIRQYRSEEARSELCRKGAIRSSGQWQAWRRTRDRTTGRGVADSDRSWKLCVSASSLLISRSGALMKMSCRIDTVKGDAPYAGPTFVSGDGGTGGGGAAPTPTSSAVPQSMGTGGMSMSAVAQSSGGGAMSTSAATSVASVTSVASAVAGPPPTSGNPVLIAITPSPFAPGGGSMTSSGKAGSKTCGAKKKGSRRRSGHGL